MPEISCVLHERPGRVNTDATLQCAVARIRELGLTHAVVASNTGVTAEALADQLPEGVTLVCVTHQVGFRSPGEDELPAAARSALTDRGVAVLTTTHLTGGIDRACRFKSQGLYPGEIVAHTLRILGQGLKVAVEISAMAADAGLVPVDREVLAVGGTGRGADTAAVVLPAHGHDIFGVQVREILAMPRGRG